MLTVIIKAPVVVKGYPNIKLGEPVEIPNHDAAVLVGMGVAEYVEAKKADGFTTGRGVIEQREPEVQHRDPETPPQKPSGRKPAK